MHFLTYCAFLITASVVAYGSTPTSSYYLTKAITSLFIERTSVKDNQEVSFKSIVLPFQIWEYLDAIIIEGFDMNYFDLKLGNRSIEDDDKKILNENIFLGVPRLRQLRMKNDSCTIYEAFKNKFSKCFATYSTTYEEKSSFGLHRGSAWTYSSDSSIKSFTHWGKLAVYGGGGYYADLSIDKNESLSKLQVLREFNWIDRYTSVIFLDFSLYNANLNLFCIVKIVFEKANTGYIIPSYSINTIDLVKFVDWFGYVLLVFEILYSLILAAYTAQIVLKLFRKKKQFFKKIWNYFDIAIILISFLVIGYDISDQIIISQNLNDYIKESDEFINFDGLLPNKIVMNNLVALLIFLIWIKFFKYLNINISMAKLNQTLKRGVKEIVSFSIMFSIFFIAFAQMGTLLFGSKIESYSTFSRAFFTLFRIILGDFDYITLREHYSVLGQIYFFSFVFIVFFILLNVFLAILADAYIQVKHEEYLNNEKLCRFYERVWFFISNILIACHFIKRNKESNSQNNRVCKNDQREHTIVDMDHQEQIFVNQLSIIQTQQVNIQNSIIKLSANMKRTERELLKELKKITEREPLEELKKIEKNKSKN